jgi:hypothetical protein
MTGRGRQSSVDLLSATISKTRRRSYSFSCMLRCFFDSVSCLTYGNDTSSSKTPVKSLPAV